MLFSRSQISEFPNWLEIDGEVTYLDGGSCMLDNLAAMGKNVVYEVTVHGGGHSRFTNSL